MADIIAFGRPSAAPTESEAIVSASATPDTPEQASLDTSIDSLIKLIQDNRREVESFMGLLTLKEGANGASGFQMFASPMSLAQFSLGVRILDGAADAMLHGR